MSLNYLGIWFRCFIDVITPNYYTLGMLVAALAVFGIMRYVYSSKQVSEQSALKQVGQRWRNVGFVIMIAVAVIYIAECVIMYTSNVNIIANKEEPKDAEFELLLKVTENDFAMIRARNKKKLETQEVTWDSLRENYELRDTVTLADVKQIELSKKFSNNVKGTALGRFYAMPHALNDRQTKVDAAAQLAALLKYKAGSPRAEQLNICSDKLFTDPRYATVIEDFKVKLQEKFDKDNSYGFEYFTGKVTDPITGKTTEEYDYDGTGKGTFEDLAQTKMMSADEKIISCDRQERMLLEVLNSPATEDGTETYAQLFGNDFKKDFVQSIRKAHQKTLSNPDKIGEIVRTAAKAVKGAKSFNNKSDKEKIDEVLKRTNAELGKIWKKNLETEIVINHMAGKEKLLYMADDYNYTLLKQNEKNLNQNLVTLLNISVWLTNFFWLVLIYLIVLFAFILRGSKIISLGDLQKIKNKIKG